MNSQEMVQNTGYMFIISYLQESSAFQQSLVAVSNSKQGYATGKVLALSHSGNFRNIQLLCDGNIWPNSHNEPIHLSTSDLVAKGISTLTNSQIALHPDRWVYVRRKYTHIHLLLHTTTWTKLFCHM